MARAIKSGQKFQDSEFDARVFFDFSIPLIGLSSYFHYDFAPIKTTHKLIILLPVNAI